MNGDTLTLPFLGQRNYLQGTTLFEALESYIEVWDEVIFKISEPMLTNTLSVNFIPDQEKNCAILHYAMNSSRRSLYVTPLELHPPVHRDEYNEHKIENQAIFYDKSVELHSIWPYSFVKMVVSLNKALLRRLYPHKTEGQWLFVGLELHQYPLQARLRVQIEYCLPGCKLVGSQLFLDDRYIGNLLFSYVSKKIGQRTIL